MTYRPLLKSQRPQASQCVVSISSASHRAVFTGPTPFVGMDEFSVRRIRPMPSFLQTSAPMKRAVTMKNPAMIIRSGVIVGSGITPPAGISPRHLHGTSFARATRVKKVLSSRLTDNMNGAQAVKILSNEVAR